MAKKATTLAPNWDEPYYLAGVSYYFTRLYDESARSLARAVELNPNSARALFLEAIALANLGKTGDAERCLVGQLLYSRTTLACTATLAFSSRARMNPAKLKTPSGRPSNSSQIMRCRTTSLENSSHPPSNSRKQPRNSARLWNTIHLSVQRFTS